MSPQKIRVVGITVVVCLLSMYAFGHVTAANEYTLETQNEIETPERTVSYDGQELTLADIGVVEQGNTLSVEAGGPSHPLTVQLRSATNPGPLLASDQLSSDGTVSFAADQSPGTYMVLLSYGEYRRGVPVVVSGYDISAEVIKNTTADKATISAEVTPTASSGQPSSVDAVIWNENTEQSVTLTQLSTGQYETQVSTAAFDDEYDVYVVARGGGTIYDSSEKEILGIAEAVSSENSDSDSNGGDGSSSNDSSSPSTGGSQPDSDTNMSANDSINATDGTNETNLANNGTGNETELPNNGTIVDGNQTEANGSSTDETPRTDDGDNTDGVIEPNNSTQNDSNTTGSNETDDQTPLSTSLVVIALLSVAFLFSRDV